MLSTACAKNFFTFLIFKNNYKTPKKVQIFRKCIRKLNNANGSTLSPHFATVLSHRAPLPFSLVESIEGESTVGSLWQAIVATHPPPPPHSPPPPARIHTCKKVHIRPLIIRASSYNSHNGNGTHDRREGGQGRGLQRDVVSILADQ
jgi:hypothetical protein